MKIRKLTSQYQRLTWLVTEASKFNAEQLELQAHWAKYLCVLSAGLLENALVEVYSAYARVGSNLQVANYVTAKLSRVQNPKAGRFIETARSFDKSWGDDLEQFLNIDGRKEAIDSIMTNRHQIAHGKDSNISLVRVKSYLLKSVEVIEYIENQCGVSVE